MKFCHSEIGIAKLSPEGSKELITHAHFGVNPLAFNSFDLLESHELKGILKQYFEQGIQFSKQLGSQAVLEIPMTRTSDFPPNLGYMKRDVENANEKALVLGEEVLGAVQESVDSIISASIGPRNRIYRHEQRMSPNEAKVFHRQHIDFLASRVKMISAIAMHNPEEAVGIVLLAQEYNLPVVISFNMDSYGFLPSGYDIKEAIELVDWATETAPAYYLIEGLLPSRYFSGLEADKQWIPRIKGLRMKESEFLATSVA